MHVIKRVDVEESVRMIRMELHAHTKMSEMKGLIDPSEIVDVAIDRGLEVLAVTDCGSVQAFPEVFNAAKRAWEEGKDLHVIYGAEGYLRRKSEKDIEEFGKCYPILIYARNDAGLKNLYKLVSKMHRDSGEPWVDTKELSSLREGLLIGTVCENGELAEAILSGKDEPEIREVVSFYDFIEITPYCEKESKVLSGLFQTGKKSEVPVIFSSDAYYISSDHKSCYEILREAAGTTIESCRRPAHLKDITDFEHTVSVIAGGLSDIEEKDVEDYILGSMRRLADMTEQVTPVRDGRFWPKYPGAEDALEKICVERACELYGEPLPDEVKYRLDEEISAILRNGYADIFMIWKEVTDRSRDEGHPVGSRGSVGASFVAFLLGITMTNPLAAHYRCGKRHYALFVGDTDGKGTVGYDLESRTCPVCGEKLIRDGFDLSVETFMGIDLDREPDIDLYFAHSIQRKIQDSVRSLPGVGDTCMAGTIGTLMEDKTRKMVENYFEAESGTKEDDGTIEDMSRRMCGVKWSDGMHPGGVMIVPDGMEFTDFTPVTLYGPEGRHITHFEYHSLDDSLLKLDILGHRNPDMLKSLHEFTGIDPMSVPFADEKVMALFSDEKTLEMDPPENMEDAPGLWGIPEFGNEYAVRVIRMLKPTKVTQLIKIDGMLHGTGVWLDNARELIGSGIAGLDDCIGNRDDVMQYMEASGFDRRNAFGIMQTVRKGRRLSKIWHSGMQERNIPDWYIDSCSKIKYLFPKAHAALYTMMALIIAWY